MMFFGIGFLILIMVFLKSFLFFVFLIVLSDVLRREILYFFKIFVLVSLKVILSVVWLLSLVKSFCGFFFLIIFLI